MWPPEPLVPRSVQPRSGFLHATVSVVPPMRASGTEATALAISALWSAMLRPPFLTCFQLHEAALPVPPATVPAHPLTVPKKPSVKCGKVAVASPVPGSYRVGNACHPACPSSMNSRTVSAVMPSGNRPKCTVTCPAPMWPAVASMSNGWVSGSTPGGGGGASDSVVTLTRVPSPT
jgi:hypothetical protein